MRKTRQQAIIKIITKSKIETQSDLTDALRSEGYDVTQATVSRDIQELGLTKSSLKGERAYYVKPLDSKLNKLKTLFHQAVVSIEGANNFIVLKTISGGANSACALIDKLEHPEIMGAIAGDDTILVIIRNATELKNVVNDFELLLEEN
ncbi:MAG: arginine repressor [Firmicutes bacterium]|nr:arginine repressor [Bacillota bacterium]